MTMLAMLKSIIWNGPTTVHLQLALHLTDLCLLSVSGTRAAVGKETNNRKLKRAELLTRLSMQQQYLLGHTRLLRISQYLLDREKDLEGLWFLSLERDLSLLLSLEKDLQKPNNPIM